MTILISIIVVTILLSIQAFNDIHFKSKLIFTPYSIFHRNEKWRLFSHAFIHADWTHLIVNMLVLYSFGMGLLNDFSYYKLSAGIYLLILYLIAILISSIPALFNQKNNPYYGALGASGAVAAVLFATIIYQPWNLVYVLGIIPVPGIIFGIIYIIYSFRMDKAGKDNIGHSAHLWGAITGLIFPLFIDPMQLKHFINLLFFIK